MATDKVFLDFLTSSFLRFRESEGVLYDQLSKDDVESLRKKYFDKLNSDDVKWQQHAGVIKNIDEKDIDEFFENQINKERVIGATDYRISNWFDSTSGFKFKIYSEYLKSIRSENGNEQAENVDSSTYVLLNKCHDPNDKDDWGNGRRGLVYGQVQSGKTSNYIGLLARALDTGYKMVIVLSGLYEDLRVQTQERIDNDLFSTLSKVKDTGAVIFGTTTEADVNRKTRSSLKNNLKTISAGKSQLILVVKKQKSVLENISLMIREFLEERDETSHGLDFPVLIIDDEADHGSIRSMTKKSWESWRQGINVAHSRESDDADLLSQDHANKAITALNRNIRVLLSLLRRVTFVQYTATPYSVLMQTSQAQKYTTTIENYEFTINANNDLFPEHFCVVIEPGSKYLGLEHFFGNEAYHYPNRISLIPEIDCDSSLDLTKITPSLESALYDFIAASLVIRFAECQKDTVRHKFLSMLVHPDVKTDRIETTATSIKKWVTSLRHKLSNSEPLVLDKVRVALKNYKQNHTNGNADNVTKEVLLNTLEKFSDYELSKNILDKVFANETSSNIPKFEIISYHSVRANQRDKELGRLLNFESKKQKDIRTYIVVGGLSLSRGLTLKGLVTSYLIRVSSQMDTLSQMARWYGYRIGTEFLVRLYINQKALSYYKALCEFDRAQRDLFVEADNNGQTPGELEFSFYVNQPVNIRKNWKRLQIASSSKMRSTIKSTRRIYGAFNNNDYFLDYTSVNKNGKTFFDFLEKIKGHRVADSEIEEFKSLLKKRSENATTPSRNALFYRGVSFNDVYNYITELKIPIPHISSEFDVPFLKTIFEDLKRQIDNSKFSLENWSVEIDIVDNKSSSDSNIMSIDQWGDFPLRRLRMTEDSRQRDIYSIRSLWDRHNFMFDILNESNIKGEKRVLREAASIPAICFRFNGFENISGDNKDKIHYDRTVGKYQYPVILFGLRIPKVTGMESLQQFSRHK